MITTCSCTSLIISVLYPLLKLVFPNVLKGKWWILLGSWSIYLLTNSMWKHSPKNPEIFINKGSMKSKTVICIPLLYHTVRKQTELLNKNVLTSECVASWKQKQTNRKRTVATNLLYSASFPAHRWLCTYWAAILIYFFSSCTRLLSWEQRQISVTTQNWISLNLLKNKSRFAVVFLKLCLPKVW